MDFREFYLSARGIAFMNALAFYIKKYDFEQDLCDVDISAIDLAVSFEIWFDEFKKLWRLRNKESELRKIEVTITTICSFLRKQRSN